MASYLDYEGLENYHDKNKEYINEKIPKLIAGNNITLSTNESTNEVIISSNNNSCNNNLVYSEEEPTLNLTENLIWIG